MITLQNSEISQSYFLDKILKFPGKHKINIAVRQMFPAEINSKDFLCDDEQRHACERV